MEMLKRFYDIGIPHLSKSEQERFKCHLFSIVDLLSFNLDDRFNLLRDFLGDRKLKAFLTFLYNQECDDFRRDHLTLGYGGCEGKPEVVFRHVANLAQEYEDQKIFALRTLFFKINILSSIGYEKYFYDIRDELLFYCLAPLGLTFGECFLYYGKDTSSWLKNLESDKLKFSICDQLHTLYNNSDKRSIAVLLILKLLSCDVFSKNDQPHLAYVEGRKLYINETLIKEANLPLLLHEACHLLHSYEDRFKDFLNAFGHYCEPYDIAKSWATTKERCINQFIRTHCYLKTISRTINSNTTFDTLSITTSVMLDLKQKNQPFVNQIWK